MFWVYNKIRRKIQEFPYAAYSHTIASAIINIPHQGGSFVLMNEPIHHHPKSVVDIKVYLFIYLFICVVRLLIFKNFHWRIIALQCCAGFC